MAAMSDMLRTTEAAVVSGVGVRDVNRALDEGILEGFATGANGRRFSAAACVVMTFYYGSANCLTAQERKVVIARMAPRLKLLDMRALRTFSKNGWVFRDSFLTIDMAPFLKSTAECLERLEAARAIVTVSPDVLGGTPVIAGTRIPVHDVAASLAAGYSREAILSAYPSLTAGQLDLAALYAKANPPRGRPRAAALPKHATVISERQSPRPTNRV